MFASSATEETSLRHNVLNVEYFFISHQLSIGFQIFHDLLLVLLRYEVLTHATKFTFQSFRCQHLCCFPVLISAVICLLFSVFVLIASRHRSTGIDVWLFQIVLRNDYSHFDICLLPLFFSSCRDSSTEVEIS